MPEIATSAIADVDHGYFVRQIREAIGKTRPNLTPRFRSKPVHGCRDVIDRAVFGAEANHGVNVPSAVVLKKICRWLLESS
jgi:hypothetical protein